METVVLKVEGLDCPSCAKTVEKGLKKLKGIEKQNPTFLPRN
ncbi:MAG: heavy-metal-associated domain-containing protein [Streptococcus sp.]